MTTTNRYAPPKAALEDLAGNDAQMWREGKVLVIRKGDDFPDRCIKCNAPSVSPRRRYKLTWHSPWLYLLILAALLLYAIVAVIVRKTAVVNIGLCERHQKRVLWGRIIGWGGLALEIVLAIGSAMLDMPSLGITALLLALPWMIATMVVNRLVLPQRIDETYVRLNGCGPAFLRSLQDRTWQ
jgi:hypothetical protein